MIQHETEPTAERMASEAIHYGAPVCPAMPGSGGCKCMPCQRVVAIIVKLRAVDGARK